jgi:hypothetical protein
MPSARVVEGTRAEITIAWFRSDRNISLRADHSSKTLPGPIAHRSGFQAHLDTALPNTLHANSLFQRPPPLQN